MLKIKDVMNVMENEYAPLNLKQSYDNVGLMVGDSKEEITSILIALDCTLKVIEEAKEKKCNFIITHHPLLFKKPSTITTETLIGKKIIKLIQNNINVYSSHTNLDSTKDGINEIIADILGLDNYKILESNSNLFHGYETGIGRIATLDAPISLNELCERVKEKLNIDKLRYVGDLNSVVNTVAVVNGSGNDLLNRAKDMGADCIITGDTTYHYASDFKEEGISIIDAGHFGTEWIGMKVVGEWLQNRIKTMGFDTKVYISEETICPYEYK